jgi:hypothetical protein
MWGQQPVTAAAAAAAGGHFEQMQLHITNHPSLWVLFLTSISTFFRLFLFSFYG